MNLRIATEADAGGVAEIYAPIVASSPISFEIDPPDAAEMRRRIRDVLPAYPWLVCETQGQIAGYAYAGAHGTRAGYLWSVNTSVYVHPTFHRRGVGTSLYELLFDVLVAQGYVKAFAGITLPNPGSVGLHEATGFRLVGVYEQSGFKDGVWYDVGWWQRPLQPIPEEPKQPLTIVELARDPAWVTRLRADRFGD